MKSSIRLNFVGKPYVEIKYTHRHPMTAAEDALEQFFRTLDMLRYSEEPLIPVAIYRGKEHTESNGLLDAGVSQINIELMTLSEFMEWAAQRKVSEGLAGKPDPLPKIRKR